MNIDFYYYCDIHEKPIWFYSNIYDDFAFYSKMCPDFMNVIKYLMTEELVIMDQIYREFRTKYDLIIKFHTQYYLENGISDPKRSMERKKDKYDLLDNRLSFSITSKTQSILVLTCSTNGFVHVPDNMRLTTDKPLPIKIIDIDTMNLMLDQKIFSNKAPTFRELLGIVDELSFLNSKLEDFKKDKRPLLLKTTFMA